MICPKLEPTKSRFAALLLAVLFLAVLLLWAAPYASSQANEGELQLYVTDPAGLPAKVSVSIVCQANQFAATLATTAQGRLIAQRLPFGTYLVEIKQQGFAEISQSIAIRSAIPVAQTILLKLASVHESVIVDRTATLLDTEQAGSVDQIGAEQIQNRPDSLPGRSLQDLVNAQPGWLYEGNAVLHPRGSEYQTQFVIDGIPLTDNRSPSLGPEIEADDVQSMSVYTAGIPAEYGRKMGGVIEVNTLQNQQPGFHGQAVFSGGSFATAATSAQGQFVWGKNTLGASGSGSRTSHYLNPVVPQNYTNAGTQADFAAHYARDFTAADQLGISLRHELARYDIPNEMLQQAAAQRQTSDNFETMGIASYQHTHSAHAATDLRAMGRDNSNDFNSNPHSTPIEVFQHNSIREGYFKAAFTFSHGIHEWKTGAESDNTWLHENLHYQITDPTQFDPGTAPSFAFTGQRPDLEQSVYLQDLIHSKLWTANLGLRWDHYQLLRNRQALEPRLAVSRYFPVANLVAHFAYDRVFQTPSFENILLSSSTEVASISPSNFLRLPVVPSHGDYYEAGFTEVFASHLRLGMNYFRRNLHDFADDNQLANTTISFPISLRKAIIYGAEGTLQLPDWRHVSGFASYSYSLGNAWYPVTGGLFLGSNATTVPSQLTGHFPVSQDQRHTLRTRLRYQAFPRLWVAGGLQFDSGLPFQFEGDQATALAEYGQAILDRINFDRGRIKPTTLISASAGSEIYKSDHLKMTLQVDGQNLNNVLNVIDFGGLFSGNAIGPSRSFSMRLVTSF